MVPGGRREGSTASLPVCSRNTVATEPPHLGVSGEGKLKRFQCGVNTLDTIGSWPPASGDTSDGRLRQGPAPRKDSRRSSMKRLKRPHPLRAEAPSVKFLLEVDMGDTGWDGEAVPELGRI